MKIKEERLDEILLRHGYVTEGEIKQALLRQKAHGGRLGSHLLYFKFIGEEELVQALSAQHDIPGFRLDEHDISRKAVKKLPIEIAVDCQVLPIDFDKKTQLIKIAVVDPTDTEMIRKVKLAFRAKEIELYVAPESLLRMLITQYYGKRKAPEVSRVIELPQLLKDGLPADVVVEEEVAHKARVLMFANSKAMRNSLVPLMEREGTDLDVASNERELKAKLHGDRYKQILVPQNSMEQFSKWTKDNELPLGDAEVVTFSSVSDTLLDNPVPYNRITRSLLRSLHIVAETRCHGHAWTPPYVLICNDIRQLGRSFGFSRLAVDGLQIAAYLLIPERPPRHKPDEVVTPNHLVFVDFQRSIDIAKSLHFPWNVQGVLKTFLELIRETKALSDVKTENQELRIGAQILALVWYHRVVLQAVEGSPDEVTAAAKSNLLDQAGHFADFEVIEAYSHLLEYNSDEPNTAYNQIFVVSETDEMTHQFVSRLTRAGFHTVHLSSMEEAKQLCDRHPPAAIIIDRECYPQHIAQASGMFKLGGIVLLYAYTRERDPSLALDLLDAGFDDVFEPPHDFNVIATRISKSLRGLMKKGGSAQSGGFTANFKAFSFIDLIQTLGQSIKTVRIDLSNSEGASGVIFLERGSIVHAVCGEAKGEDAIYEILRWGDDGSFSLEPTDDVPEANVVYANEAILMEGCRLLDESRI
jgi:hypothetical protein